MTRADWTRWLTGMVILVGTLMLSGNAILAYIAYCIFGVVLTLWLAWYLRSMIRERMYNRRSGLLRSAFQSGDLTAARKYLLSLAFIKRYPIGAAMLDMDEAVILCYEERFSEAQTLLEKIDSSVFNDSVPHLIPYLINNLAACNAHLGKPDKAIELLAPFESNIESAPEDLRASIMSTIGIARLFKGNFTDGASMLEEAMNRGGLSFGQSISAYYLAEAYSAIGESAKARAAYQRAIDECPTSRCAERAREKLGQQ